MSSFHPYDLAGLRTLGPALRQHQRAVQFYADGDSFSGGAPASPDDFEDLIGILERCEQRDRQAVKKAGRGFFGRLFG